MVLRSERGLRPLLRRIAAGVGVWAALALGLALPVAGQTVEDTPTPIGTRILNRATASYEVFEGGPLSIASDSTEVVVGEAPGVFVTPPRAATPWPGSRVIFAHTITNTWALSDDHDVEVSSSTGWPVQLYHDTDGNGQLTPADTLIIDPVPVGTETPFPIIVAVDVPATAPGGTIGFIDIEARSVTDSTRAGSVRNTITVRNQPLTPDMIELRKEVDLEEAPPGEVLNYTLRMESYIDGAVRLLVEDPIPSMLEYLPGSMRLDGVPITDREDGDGAIFDQGTRTVRLEILRPTPGVNTLTFSARVASNAPVDGTIENRGTATLDFGGLGGISGEASASTLITDQCVQVDAAPCRVEIRKESIGPEIAKPGDLVGYRIEVWNTSLTMRAVDLRVVDLLPESLVLTRTLPEVGSDADGYPVWEIDSLEPGERRSYEIWFEVGAVEAPSEIVNYARLDHLGVPVREVPANPITLIPLVPIRAGVEKSVDRAVAAPGDRLLYAIRATASGDGDLRELIVRDTLPAGVSFLPGSIQTSVGSGSGSGAVAVEERDGVIVARLSDPVAGETLLLTYRVEVDPATPAGRLVLNRAWAEVHSEEEGPVDVAMAEAVTRISPPDLQILKSVTGPNPATEGDTLIYVIEVTNSSESESTAEGLTVADTLPIPLRAVSTTLGGVQRSTLVGELDGSGRRFLWTIPSLAPGESYRIELLAEVGVVPDEMDVVNEAQLIHHGVRAGEAESEPVRLIPTRPATITLDLVSERLELFQGELLPLVATLRNSGEVPVSELRIEITIPEGLRWIEQEVRGAFGAPAGSGNVIVPSFTLAAAPGDAQNSHGTIVEYPIVLDSVEVVGNTLFIYFPGELAPGQEFRAAFDLLTVGGAGNDLLIEAVAEGRRGSFGAEAISRVVAAQAVQVQAETDRSVLETRTALGRVFIDLDGDGIQREGEVGVPGVEIWTEDGEVVRTDGNGSYTFHDLRPGRHLLRIDPLSLPDGVVPTRGSGGMGAAYIEMNGWISARASFPLQAVGAGADELVTEDAAQDSVPEGDTLSIAPLRSEEERTNGAAATFLTGPGIQFFTPADGFISATNKIYLGVKGEPGARVQLFRNEEILDEKNLRPDGVMDFVGLDLVPGPQVFRVRMTNSWGQAKWDSIAVHFSGETAEFRPASERISLAADGRTRGVLRVQLLDEWGIPVVTRPRVTVSATGAHIVSTDDDTGSTGIQIEVDERGWIVVEMVGGTEAGMGELLLRLGEVTRLLPIEVNPEIRPLFMVGAGQLTFGAGGENFGAVTARGRLGDKTAITLGYDSRRLDQGRESFNRSSDPLAENRYPTTGDTSEQRSILTSRYAFYGKVERGQSWLVFGDITEGWFSDGLGLARYERAVPGIAGQWSSGAIVWNAFAASTTQSIVQREFRGSGVSGPFSLGGGVLSGTERVVIEARDRQNPTRIVNREELQRFTGYEISYETGVILLRRPLSAEDLSGNLLFLVVTYEGEGDGQDALLGGLRGAGDIAKLLGSSTISAPVALSIVHDAQTGRPFTMAALNGELRARGASVRAEVAHASLGDSSDVALRIEGTLPLLSERLELTAAWTRIGEEFANPASSAARAGSQEILAEAAFEITGTRLAIGYEEQEFQSNNLSRNRLSLEAVRQITEGVEVETRLAREEAAQNTGTSSTLAGEAEARWKATDRLTLFAEGREEFQNEGSLGGLGSSLGAGASFRILDGIALDGRHQYVVPEKGSSYALTRIGITAEPVAGSRGWGGYQRATGADGLAEGTVVGLSHEFRLGEAWGFQGMLERRNGVVSANASDPVRGTPFGQDEKDYLSVGAGVEYLPVDRPYRLTLRGESKRGEEGEAARLLLLAGEMNLGRGIGLLTRNEFRDAEQLVVGGMRYSRNRSSLLGVAYRPAFTDNLNILARFEIQDILNPAGSSILVGEERETKVIGGIEAIWTPMSRVEVGGRVALRNSVATTTSQTTARLESQGRFLGGHIAIEFTDRIGAKVTARGLFVPRADYEAWDIAPAILITPMGGLQIETGYRFGDLSDPDFAIRSGEGWYTSLGIQITESAVSKVTDFWRERIR